MLDHQIQLKHMFRPYLRLVGLFKLLGLLDAAFPVTKVKSIADITNAVGRLNAINSATQETS